MEDLGQRTFWLDRAVFVTGGAGLVGGSLVRRLLQAGATVVCLVRDWVPQCELVRSRLLDHVRVVRGELADQALLERVLAEYEIRTVFHLAAQAIVPVANRNPGSTFESNVAGTWKLLEACRRSPMVEQIVVASSDKVYGDCPALPYTEQTPLCARHPYDVSKACADLIAQSYAATFQTPVVVTRCGNYYGPGDLNFNRLVPGTIRSVLRGQRPVIRSDGQYVRDYFYVEDGAVAYMTLAEALARDPTLAGEAFNFSTETPLSVLEMVRRILGQMRSALEPVILGQATHEIRHQYLSAAKARQRLGWGPRYTLQQGLAETIAWYETYFREQDAQCRTLWWDADRARKAG